METEAGSAGGFGSTLKHFGRTLANALKSGDNIVHAVGLQITFSLCFLLGHRLPPFFGSDIVIITSGLIALLAIPGALVSTIVLPLKSRGLFSTLALGIVVQLVGFQLLFSAALLSLPSIDVVSWTTIVSCAVVLVCTLQLRLKGTKPSLGDAFALPRSSIALAFLATGLIIRLFVYSSSAGCLAPDAALYSDYARSLVSGGMQSSVQNDEAVVSLAPGVDYIAHHTITFFFALSWIIVPPSGSAPTALLVLIGIAIMLAVYEITDSLAGGRTASFVLCVLAVQPIFVFHSAVGYGPESLSLLLALLCLKLWVTEPRYQQSVMALSGALIGTIESIWLANFYVLCVVLCILVPVWLKMQRREWIVFSLLVLMLFIARMFYKNLAVFLLLWVLVTVVPFLDRVLSVGSAIKGTRGFFIGAFLSMVFWSWPIYLISSQTSTVQISPSNPVGSLLLASMSVFVVINFLLFLAVHVSIPLMGMVLASIREVYHAPNAMATLTAAAAIAAGTLGVLSLYAGSLELQYIFSDSRFFLFIAVLTGMTASFVSERFLTPATEWAGKGFPGRHFLKRNRKTLVAGALIAIGFVPGYLAMPAGFALVNYEQRYAWSGLNDVLLEHGIDNGTFLVDRAREFSWYTGSQSVVLRLTSADLPDANASSEIAILATRFNASHVLIDAYTITHWRTLEYLYSDDISIGTVLPLNVSTMFESGENETESVPALRLVASTEEDGGGHYVRIFLFCEESFRITERIDFLSPGWEATGYGSISNHSGVAAFEIASDRTGTTVWRPGGSDLNMTTGSGALLMSFLGTEASVTRVEVWDKDGNLVRYADSLGEGRFACSFGNITIGDIRVIVDGSPGGYVLVTSASIWVQSTA